MQDQLTVTMQKLESIKLQNSDQKHKINSMLKSHSQEKLQNLNQIQNLQNSEKELQKQLTVSHSNISDLEVQVDEKDSTLEGIQKFLQAYVDKHQALVPELNGFVNSLKLKMPVWPHTKRFSKIRRSNRTPAFAEQEEESDADQ